MKARFNKKSSYTQEKAAEYIEAKEKIYCVSTECEAQFKYEDNKRTDEIIGYRAWFSQEGLPPFQVKFNHDVKLPKYMSLVEFDNLQGIEIHYNVYFKADDVIEVK